MFTIISRIFHFGAKNFWRNGWLSTATVAIMTLSLIVSLGLIMFGVVTHAAANAIQDKIDISVYFNTTTSEDEILNIQQSLEGLSQVQSVDYVSRDQALATFQQNNASNPTISQVVQSLDTNPLEASLNIKAKNPSQYGEINDYLSSPGLAPYIDTTSYLSNQDVITALARIVQRHGNGRLGGDSFPRAHRWTCRLQHHSLGYLFQPRRDRHYARRGCFECPGAWAVRG